MKLGPALAALAACGLCAGCPGPKKPGPSHIGGTASPARITHVRAEVQPLGYIPNGGLQMPAASPDGRWVAYLDVAGPAVSPGALHTGEGLEGVSLHVCPAERAAAAREICAAGACWPCWSADGRLAFLAYGAQGRCDVCVYDAQTRRTRRLGPGLGPLAMLAVSPDGSRAAVIATAKLPAPARLHLVDLETGQVTPCPVGADDEEHRWPFWTPDGRVLLLVRRRGQWSLAHWKPGGFGPEVLLPVPLGPTRLDLHQAFAGLARPVSPDGARLAYYQASADRIVLLDPRSRSRQPLPEGTRAGVWLDARTFVAVTDRELLLFPRPGAEPVGLLRGPWLPLAAPPGQRCLLLCQPGRHPREFGLVRVTLLAAE